MEQEVQFCAFVLTLLLPALAVCVLVPTILLLKRRKKLKLKLKLPPGPRRLPIIGHLHLLGSNPHRSFMDLSKIYGPLIFLQLGSVPVVVVSSPSMAKLILQARDQIFSCRQQPAVPMQLHGCTNLVFSQPGPYWKLMRKLCLTELFSNKRLRSFQPVMEEEMRALLRSIFDCGGEQEVPLRESLYTGTHNIISRITLGKGLQDLAWRSQADPSYNLVTLLVESIHLIGVFNVGDFIPAVAWMDLQGCVRKSKAVAKKLHIVLQELIDGRREMMRGQSKSASEEELDFLDVLLSSCERQDIPITDLNVMGILIDMFAGGIDTSSITVEWAIGELLTNPIKMKKVQDELEQVVGMSRLVHESDIDHLPYLQAVVKETMRLHPVIPLLVPHMASQQCHISGYDIPSNTLAYVNVWAIGRDPSVWDRPLEFLPERFFNCTVDVFGHHFELLPFGSGRRACPGMILGLTTVQYMLASLLHVFNWTTIDEPSMSEKFGLVMTLEDPLIVKATPKVPRQLLVEAHV